MQQYRQDIYCILETIKQNTTRQRKSVSPICPPDSWTTKLAWARHSCVTDCQVRFAFNNCADICTRWCLPSFSSPTDSLPWQINTFQNAQFSIKRKSIHWIWDQVSAFCRRISIKPGILGRYVGHASHSLDTIPTAALDCHWLYCSSFYDEGHEAEAGWTCENAEEEPELLYRNSHGKRTFYTEA